MTDSFFDQEIAPLSHRVMVGLTKVATALNSQSWQNADAMGLSPTQGKILALVKERRVMRLSLVAKELGVSAATASDAVKALVSKGLVEKGRDPDDGRAIAITLTDAGKQSADQTSAWPQFLANAVGQLSPQEQEVFLTGLVKVIQNLQQGGQVSVARMCVTCQHFQPNVYVDSDRPHHCGFVDAPFGEKHFQVDCPDYLPRASNPAIFS